MGSSPKFRLFARANLLTLNSIGSGFGYRRSPSDKLQIVYGLLCNRADRMLAAETADPETLGSQVQNLKARFRLDRVVVVGDRRLFASAWTWSRQDLNELPRSAPRRSKESRSMLVRCGSRCSTIAISTRSLLTTARASG